MKRQRGLDYKYIHASFKPLNWYRKHQLINIRKKSSWTLDCHVIFSERRLSDIEQLPYSSDSPAVVSNKIKIITNCIRIDLCIWRSQNMYITAIHRPSRKLRGGICRYETFWMRIFERTTFLLLRCRSIHVKLCVLVTYSARNWV